jgi:sugar lactone lactonase YvrE
MYTAAEGGFLMPGFSSRMLIHLVLLLVIAGCGTDRGDLVEPSTGRMSSTALLATAVEDPPQFILEWGSQGAGDGQFNEPWGLVAGGVAVDAMGNVYAANIFNRIHKFDSDGNLLMEWGSEGSGDGQLFVPHDVAVDKSGNVYVADTGNHRIQKFTSEGIYITKWGTPGIGNDQISNPFGVDVGPDGNVYVIETGNSRVHKFTSDGVHITKWGSFGTGTGRFRSPTGICVDKSGNVYVADTDNHRVQKFTSSGVFLTQWGSLGSGQGQFSGPGDVAVDGRGNVYVADTFNHRIQKFGSPTQSVDLDLKPGSCPNPLNPGSRGVLPVAILGTTDFDVHDIDVSSVLLEGVLAPLRSSIDDVATGGAGGGQGCDCTTDGPDGLDDLTLKFRTEDVASVLGTLAPGEARELTMSGQLLDGTSFEGADCVVIVGNPRKGNPESRAETVPKG